ncbi:hypothetical protein F5Y10DRAFT_259589 [Nemania abortiva]|nr:hypothetical protein F5Y10DRAFT_259589 [Nemania abortiva]
MDPLSEAAAVAGLLTATHKVAKLLKPYVSASQETLSIAAHVRDETECTRAVLIGLQTFVRGFPERVPPGGTLVNVDQLITILTSGVLLFAELEGEMRGLVADPPLASSEGERSEKTPGVWETLLRPYSLPLRARMQWAHREESLRPLLGRLQGSKVSVTAVLTGGWVVSDSDRRAGELQADLAANVNALLESNRDLSRRMMHLEGAFDMQTIRSQCRQSIASATTKASREVANASAATTSLGETTKETSTSTAVAAVTSSALTPSETAVSNTHNVFQSVFEFENDLKTSRVYRRAQRDSMDFSFRTSITRQHAWSMLSACSLADVSVLSVIALPLNLVDLANRHHYVDSKTGHVPAPRRLSAPTWQF